VSFICFESTAEGISRLTFSVSPDYEDLGMLRDTAASLVAAEGDVIVDCESVKYLNAAAMQILVALARAVRPQSRAFTLLHVSPELDRVIELAGLTSVFWDEADCPLSGEQEGTE